jgi:hypothetical protein
MSQEFKLFVTGLTEDTTPDEAADYIVTYDASAGVNKKVKLENLPGGGSVTTPLVWRGDWVTSTAYHVGDGVTESGSSYVCLTAHTSGTFASDLAAVKWQLIAEKGDDGSGAGNYETASNLGSSAAIATHFGSSDIPVFLDDDVTVTANPQTFPSNAKFVHGGGKFVKSGSGKIAFAGNPGLTGDETNAWFSGFAAGDITFTGTDLPKRLSASLWADTNLDAKLTRAIGAVAGKAVTVVAYPGALTAKTTLTTGLSLHLTKGTYTNSIASVGIGTETLFTLQDNTRVFGDGITQTIIEESSNDHIRIFYASGFTNFPFDGANSNIEISDLQIKGVSGTTVNSAYSAIALGNCRNGHVRRVYFKNTHGFAVYLGGFGTSGYASEYSSVQDCICDGLQTQQIGALNGRNLLFARNIFFNVSIPTSPSQAVMDLEPNSSTDVIEDIQIIDSIFDLRNCQQTANGIVVQTSDAPFVKNVRIAGNLIIGADDYRTVGLLDSQFDIGTDTLTAYGHGYRPYSQVVFTTTGTLPTGLNTIDIFYIIWVDNDHLKFATTYDNAVAGTAINLTVAGSGTHSILPLRKLATGITIGGGDNVVLENNHIRGSSSSMITVDNSIGVVIKGNTGKIVAGGGTDAMTFVAMRDSNVFGNIVDTQAIAVSQSDTVAESETTATVNTTSGSPNVTATAGDLFYSWWPGLTVTINAVDYVVKSVTDNRHLVLTTNAASTLTGTTLTSKFSNNKYWDNKVSSVTLAGTSIEYSRATDRVAASPATTTDNAITRFDGTTGRAIQNSLATIDDSGTISIPEDQGLNIAGNSVITRNSASGYYAFGVASTQARIRGLNVFLQDDTVTYVSSGGKMNFDATMTAGGTTGAQTINKVSGSVNFAAAATSLVVTNNKVVAGSIIICTVMTNDSTLKSVQAVPASGSFTIYANAAATAETKVAFLVIN